MIRLTAGALTDHRPIPLHAAGFQRAHYFVGRAGNGALWIEILDAHQPLAGVVPGLKIACDSRDQRSEMQRARGRRRKAAAIDDFHGVIV